MLTTTIARILFIFVHIASSLLSMTSLKTWFLVCRIIIKDILFYAPMMPFFTRHLLSYFFKSEGRLPVRSTRNIPYADGSCHRQRLNVYAPKMGSDSSSSGGGNKNLPVLLFVHGGECTVQYSTVCVCVCSENKLFKFCSTPTLCVLYTMYNENIFFQNDKALGRLGTNFNTIDLG